MALKKYGAIVYEKSKNEWRILSAEPHICLRLKNIFPKINKASVLPFIFPNTNENCHDLLWFMERYPLSISDTNKKKMLDGRKEYISLQDKLERILSPNYEPNKILKLKAPWEARKYQSQCAEFHKIQPNFLLGDDIGLGKTLTGTLTFFNGYLPALVVVQAHLKSHWKEKVQEYSDLSVHIIKGTKPYSLPPADIYIITYSCLAGWVDFFQTGYFKAAIFDEIQELRREESQKYKAAQSLVYVLSSAIGMSATPIYNYGDEIFNVLNLLSPGCLGLKDDFIREWCTRDGNHYIVNEPQALGTYLREQNLFLRRTRKEVGRELPPINKIIHIVGYDSDEVKKAEEIAIQLAIKATSGAFTQRGQATRELNAYVRHLTGVSKAREVAEFVKILVENGEKVILSGWHRDVYDIWLEELKKYKPVLYTGTESPGQKDKSKIEFIHGDAQILIMSLRSGTGLDGVQAVCRTVVHGELDWSPKVHEQLTGRAQRDGMDETKNVTEFYCTSEEGSDPLMIEVLGLKSSQSHGIIDPMVGITEQHSDESYLQKLANYYLAKRPQTLFT